ncbi:MAG TPA: hypothetical protein VHF22_01500, partial [Planctomycetota bacterium]|nr:hypothetical protein [Planctomycetota bacterium]
VIAYKAGHALNAALVRELAPLLHEDARVRAESAENAEEAGTASPISSANSAYSANSARTHVSFSDEAFQGHFPGDPVLPGVVTLAALRDGAEISAIESAKFRRIVRPGEKLNLEREVREDGAVRAKAKVGDDVAVDAVLRLSGNPRGA